MEAFDECSPSPKRRKILHNGGQPSNRYTHSHYTVAWICALPLEMAAARAILDEEHDPLPTPATDSNTYIFGKIKQHNVVITCLPVGSYGTNSAATVATNLKRTFTQIRVGLVVGIGGGVPRLPVTDVRLGDVVVGTKVMQYDLGKMNGELERTAFPRFPDQLLRTAVSSLDSKHRLKGSRISSFLAKLNEGFHRPTSQDRLFLAEYKHQAEGSNCEKCDQSQLVHREMRLMDSPIIHYGTVASGNQVKKNSIDRDFVAEPLNAKCFEMESAGVMDVLACLPVRGISDYSDSHKSEEWQSYAAAVAAAYSRELLEELPGVESQQIDTDQNKTMERRMRLLDSLKFSQMDSRRLTIKANHQSTCDWFLQDPRYLEWLDPQSMAQHQGFLWLSGKPGAGKSTIMKFAYLNMKKESTTPDFLVASFFFHARGEALERTVDGMYRALLFQLLDEYDDLQSVWDDPEIFPQNQDDCPSLPILQNLLLASILRLGQRSLVFFVDALDECDQQQIADMIQFFEDLTDSSTLSHISFRICFSSRHYPHISIRRGIRLTLEDQRGHTQDLEKFIDSRLRVENPGKLRPLILRKAAGVFMWVVLVVEILNKEDNRGGFYMKRRLAGLPGRLSELFKEIVRRDNENTEEKEINLLCILWIMCARRPLSPKELRHAIWSGLLVKGLVDGDIPNLVRGQDKLKGFVVSSSKGLAEITGRKDPKVQFIHESVRDFLVEGHGLKELWPGIGSNWENLCHERLKACCNIYLQHPSISQLVFGTVDLKIILKTYPFALYAAEQILHHADNASNTICQQEFLSGFQPQLSSWISLYNEATRATRQRSFRLPQMPSSLNQYKGNVNLFYILADMGYSSLIRENMKRDSDVHVRVLGEVYEYPLFIAWAKSDKSAVAAILNSDPLMLDHLGISQDSLRSAFISAGEYKCRYRTPLSWAAQCGFTGIVRLLLEAGVNVNELDMTGQTPLSRASEGGHTEVIKLLLDNGGRKVTNSVGSVDD